MFPCSLTVYTLTGAVTVHNVREDSITRRGLRLIAESDDKDMRLYTFFLPIGYSTVLTG